MADLAAFLTARYAEAEAAARDLLRTAQDVRLALQEPRLLGRVIPGWHSWPDIEAMCNSRLTDIALKRAILAEHAPAEPPKYGTDVPRCAVCLTSRGGWQEDWHADPWPCITVRRLGAEFDERSDYLESWVLDG